MTAFGRNPDVPGPRLRILYDVVGRSTVIVRAMLGMRKIGTLTAERVAIKDLSRACTRSFAELTAARGQPLEPWVVVDVRVDDAERHQGVGLDLYLGAARAVTPFGGALVANSCESGPGWTSNDAMRVWRSTRLRQYLHIHGTPRSGYVGALRRESQNPREALLTWTTPTERPR